LSNWRARFLNCCAKFAHRALPAVCVLCGSSTGGASLCAPCAASLPLLPSARCRICALPLTTGKTCGTCLDHPPTFDAVFAVYAYAFPVDALVHALKYRGNLAIAPILADALAAATLPRVDALIPAPLAAGRLRERGFNQAYELARIVARRLNVPVLAQACRKVTDTAPQAALPWKERARNVRATFVCDANLTGLRVAVVDDVMTSGATVNELARNLKRAGAAHVSAWVVARTLKT
jgi:ComF family protein